MIAIGVEAVVVIASTSNRSPEEVGIVDSSMASRVWFDMPGKTPEEETEEEEVANQSVARGSQDIEPSQFTLLMTIAFKFNI